MAQAIKNFFAALDTTTVVFASATIIAFAFVLPAIYNRFH